MSLFSEEILLIRCFAEVECTRLEMGDHGVVPSRLMWLYAGVAIRGDKLRLLRSLR